MHDVVVLEDGTFVVAGERALFRARDADAPWEKVAWFVFGVGRDLHAAPSGRLFAAVSDAYNEPGGVLASDDGGRTWRQTGLTDEAFSLAADEEGTLFAGSNRRLLRSDDDGATWTHHTSFASGYVHHLAYDDVHDVLLLGLRESEPAEHDGLYRVDPVSGAVQPIGPSGLQVDGMATDEGLVFAASLAIIPEVSDEGGGVWRSRDGGTTWSQHGNALVRLDVNSVASDAPFAYAGSFRNGIFASDDAGDTWVRYDDLHECSSSVRGASAIAVDSTGRAYALTFVGEHDLSYLYRGREGASVSAELPPAAGGFELAGVYPNPAVDRIVVDVAAAPGDRLTMHLLDLLGRVVAAAERRATGAGRIEETFDVSTLPAGLYVVRVSNGGGSRTRAVVIAH